MQSLLRKFRAGVAWGSRTAWFRRVGPRIMPPFERFMELISFGRLQASGLLVPSLLLHTVGAKTGEPRTVALMYCPDGDDCLVVASNFARENHPAWSYNLMKNPDAEISIHGKRRPVHAVRVADTDLETTWEFIQEQWPDYRKYETTSGRTLRIFRLEPRLHN